ncbi:DnaD domain protein [Bacillus thermotolerans]|uniref:DNA replication protein DnaB n=1 Tax=Bacillus thermotolerans TaxID=1221996 RepID=A0A0F5ICM7_BACTR|nr:DnaD domain protein [Bacillus thermotolerans]KKB42204.1 DNA replication protein DnaB [Bacillus thermotolerans]KKB43266.1 DNA replication protein DnaB [Bacillus thermotolerans]
MVTEELINRFKGLTSEEFLSKYKANTVSARDLEVIEELKAAGFNDGVVNVLLEFALLSSGMKMNRSLIRSIAEHWAKYEVSTIEQAIIFVRKEHRQYRKWKGSLSTRNIQKWA